MAQLSEKPGRHWLFHLWVRQKIVLILLAALVIALTANTWLALQSQERDILNEINQRGQELSSLLAQNLANSVVGHNYTAIDLLLTELVKNRDIVYARVTNTKGNTMSEVGNAAGQPNLVMFKQKIQMGADAVGELNLGLSTERIVQNLEQVRSQSILRQFIITVVVLLVVLGALSYLIVRPLGIITRTLSQEIDTEGKPPSPILLESDDEFGEMAAQFNRLHAQLEDARQILQSRVKLANTELQQANARLTLQADDLMRMNAELELLTITDPLTGLYNRRHFEQLMENEMAASIRNDETLSILLVDIDHFKNFNERHGHDTGDGVLKEIGRLIGERIRKTDIACRYEGDEFFVLCRRATISNAVSLADELLNDVSERGLNVTLSVGVATIPGVAAIRSAEEFFRGADQALQHSKRQGRNTVSHYSMLDKLQRAALS
jgi:diguanylate cyclase (GGDEF)-like protein